MQTIAKILGVRPNLVIEPVNIKLKESKIMHKRFQSVIDAAHANWRYIREELRQQYTNIIWPVKVNDEWVILSATLV